MKTDPLKLTIWLVIIIIALSVWAEVIRIAVDIIGVIPR